MASFWDSLTGNASADTSNTAAADTYRKQQGAIAGIQGAGNDYAAGFRGLGKGYDPYVRTGGAGNDALYNLINDPSSVSSTPGYQFTRDQGIQAIDRSAAARGMLGSGRTSKDLMRFGTGLADQTYGNVFQRLLAAGQYGQGALGAQNATVGQGLQGQLGAQQSAFQGGLNSAGTIGQGQVAGAQAQQQGAGNLLGTAAYLGGSFLGGGGAKKLGGLGSLISG